MEKEINNHESYGMLDICRFTGNNSEFYGSDLSHNGGISITITRGEKHRHLNTDWYHQRDELIRIEMSNSQFIDAITSGMNTSGVPCTIKRYNSERVPQISHIEDKKEQFSNEMRQTQNEFKSMISNIISKLDGNIGKKKKDDIIRDLDVLSRHLSSNTNFVLKCFNEAMEKTVTEAKHSISNYIDHKVHSLGVEGLREQLKISIESENK